MINFIQYSSVDCDVVKHARLRNTDTLLYQRRVTFKLCFHGLYVKERLLFCLFRWQIYNKACTGRETGVLLCDLGSGMSPTPRNGQAEDEKGKLKTKQTNTSVRQLVRYSPSSSKAPFRRAAWRRRTWAPLDRNQTPGCSGWAGWDTFSRESPCCRGSILRDHEIPRRCPPITNIRRFLVLVGVGGRAVLVFHVEYFVPSSFLGRVISTIVVAGWIEDITWESEIINQWNNKPTNQQIHYSILSNKMAIYSSLKNAVDLDLAI